MTGFDPQINIYALLAWLALAIGLTVWNYRGTGRLMVKSYFRSLIGLRCLSIIVFALLILQPYGEFRSPNPDGYSVKILADCSGSMTAADCVENRQRLDILKGLLVRFDGDDPPFRRDRVRDREVYGFSETPRRLFNQPPAILPGNTAIGSVLDDVLESSAHTVVGAVVLLSDGNSNGGPTVVEAAKRCKARGVPVSCVGIGERGGGGDVLVQGPKRPLKVKKGELLDIPVEVVNTFPLDAKVEVSLSDGGLQLQKRALNVTAGTTAPVSFQVRPVRAGPHVYRVRLASIPADRKPETDVDYVTAEVSEPDVFKLLFLSNALDWNYKFLKINADRNDQLQLASVVKLGRKRYYHLDLEDEETVDEKGFPDQAEAFEPFDVLIVTAGASAALSEKGLALATEFVANRGGGLLFFGAPSTAPEALRPLLPFTDAELKRPLSKRYLDVLAPFIFPPAQTEVLRTPPGPYLPAAEPYLETNELKIAARPALETRDSRSPVMAAQRYGGGRVACMGSRATWRWRMDAAVEQDRYQALWGHLLVWLGSAGKPRVDPMFNGAKLAVNQTSSLRVKILDASYLPCPDAQVTATVVAPDGTKSECPLALDARAPGVYGEIFTPTKSGEHKVMVKVEFPSEETLERSAYFVALRSGVENRDDAYREDVLRDLSRITGGRFVHYMNLGDGMDLPLSPTVPMKTERLYWLKTWPALILLLATLATEWFLRRRVGLK